MIQELLTEKLRPQKFEHLVLSERVKNALGHGQVGQNILLFGTPGTGKTSAAKVLAKGYPTLYINVSDESSVETIRTKITEFCSIAGIQDDGTLSPVKIVILDEMDGASEQFFKALRGTMEKFAKNRRFIGTCNFVNKVPEAIQSRFETVNFDFVNKEEENEVREEWKNRMSSLFKKLAIAIDEEALEEFVSRNFPDMRSALNKIQSFSIQGIKELNSQTIRELNWNFEDLYKVLVKNPEPFKNYEFIVSEYASKVDEAMHALGTEFVQWIQEKYPDKMKHVPAVLIAVATHQAQRHLVIDPVISLLSLAFTIQKQLNS
jgi:DNA polymerase III delta prime subunit